MVEPRSFTLVGDRIDGAESFIPVSSPRGFEVLRKLQEGPTEEERVILDLKVAEADAKRLAEMAALKERHRALLAAHAGWPIIETLLGLHAPVDVVHGRNVYLECHACPDYYVTEYDVTDKAEWPCPTWQTISDAIH